MLSRAGLERNGTLKINIGGGMAETYLRSKGSCRAQEYDMTNLMPDPRKGTVSVRIRSANIKGGKNAS
jgi:hypothetical protein